MRPRACGCAGGHVVAGRGVWGVPYEAAWVLRVGAQVDMWSLGVGCGRGVWGVPHEAAWVWCVGARRWTCGRWAWGVGCAT
jgi:hypothetical protein